MRLPLFREMHPFATAAKGMMLGATVRAPQRIIKHANGTPVARVLAISFSVIIGLNATCQAGILNGHSAAFEGVTGSIPFNNGSGLSGNVDYAVFTAAAFNANFAGLGYVPNDALVYTYQVENIGALRVSGETVGHIVNPANTIGTFNIGDVDASSASFLPNAEWVFATGIASGESSWGLAFSSPNIPIVGFFWTVGGEEPWMLAGVPIPGPLAVPEPASVSILAIGGVLACLLRSARRRCIAS